MTHETGEEWTGKRAPEAEAASGEDAEAASGPGRAGVSVRAAAAAMAEGTSHPEVGTSSPCPSTNRPHRLIPSCVEAAKENAKLWRWKPALKNGKPVDALGIITVTFDIFAQSNAKS
jgi:hypothetical protein